MTTIDPRGAILDFVLECATRHNWIFVGKHSISPTEEIGPRLRSAWPANAIERYVNAKSFTFYRNNRINRAQREDEINCYLDNQSFIIKRKLNGNWQDFEIDLCDPKSLEQIEKVLSAEAMGLSF